MECCGVNDPLDWKWGNNKLPDSCCSSQKNCTINSADCYRKGCGDISYRWFKNGLDLLGILAVGIAGIEVRTEYFGFSSPLTLKRY